MKKQSFFLFAFVAFAVGIVVCSNGRADTTLCEAIPEEITSVTVGGYRNGELEPWKLEPAEIEELRGWLTGLSLTHRTYREGETPNRVWNGGVGYDFDLNSGALVFSWAHIDRTYILFEGEWYEITGNSHPPLNLPD